MTSMTSKPCIVHLSMAIQLNPITRRSGWISDLYSEPVLRYTAYTISMTTRVLRFFIISMPPTPLTTTLIPMDITKDADGIYFGA
jgi:hypothetical protein